MNSPFFSRPFARSRLVGFALCSWLSAAASAQEKVSFQQRSIVNQPFVADFYFSPDSPRHLGILVLGGSEGGKPTLPAQWFAAQGYPTLAVAYFDTPETPARGAVVPLEYFAPAITWLRARPEVLYDHIIVYGASRGAELALLLAAHDIRIGGVIAQSPSAVAWQPVAELARRGMSWSRQGKPVPSLVFARDPSHPLRDQADIYAMFDRSLNDPAAVERAIIPVENIRGSILLLAGNDDRIWPSVRMADMIVARLRARNFKFLVENYSYPEAGHVFHAGFKLGGTDVGNRVAEDSAHRHLLQFLQQRESEFSSLPAK